MINLKTLFLNFLFYIFEFIYFSFKKIHSLWNFKYFHEFETIQQLKKNKSNLKKNY